MTTSDRTPADLVVYDLGTNTFRWLAVRFGGGRWHEIARGRQVIGLGRSLPSTGRIDAADLQRGADLLAAWRPGAGAVPPARAVRALATHAVRVADNRDAVRIALGNALGHPLDVIGADEEGALSFAGASSAMPDDGGRWALVDIGGGSTELSWGDGHRFEASVSLPVGVVTLAADDDEDLAASLARSRTALDRAAREVYNEGLPALLAEARPRVLASSCGTSSATALAYLGLAGFERGLLDGARVPADWLRDLTDERSAWRAADWHAVPCVGPERAGLIGPGLGILGAFVETAGTREWTNIESGLLEGAATLAAAAAQGRS